MSLGVWAVQLQRGMNLEQHPRWLRKLASRDNRKSNSSEI